MKGKMKRKRHPECVFDEIPVHCLEAIGREKQEKKEKHENVLR